MSKAATRFAFVPKPVNRRDLMKAIVQALTAACDTTIAGPLISYLNSIFLHKPPHSAAVGSNPGPAS